MPPKENPIQKRQKLDAEISKLNAEYLNASGKEADKLLTKINKLVTQWNKLSDGVKKWNDSIVDAFENLEDVDDELRSIGNMVGKNTAAYEVQRKRIEKSAATLKSISVIAKDNAKYTDKDRENLIKIGNEYKANLVSIANINRKYADGKIDLEEANKLIAEATLKYRENTSAIELSADALKEIGPTIEGMNNEVKSFGNLAEKSLSHIQHLDEIFESFEGIPALGEINKLLKTNIKDTLAFKAAVFALGAALGKAAFDYFGAPIKAAMQAHKEVAQTEIDGAAAVAKLRKDAAFIPAQIGQERLEHEIDANEQIRKLTEEAQYAGQKAAIQFSASMQQGAAQFERASKTALFGNKLGSVGYGAAQMQLAGIGADKVASSMEAAAAATGKMPTAKMGADMAIMAERTGQSVDDVAAINEAFMRMDGMSANVAMNMQEGMRNMADQAGIGLGNLMKEVAQASKEALGYQIKSGPALAKAVAYTQSMGLNFSDVAKAGKNMVMNYKDSIKAEMQLSSMLGEQVDLAEVRAKFASGDTAGALDSLKSQGLDPADMDMFQQQALQDALGGMDLNSLSKVAKNTGKDASLSAGNAAGGNKDFLSRTQSAEATMNAKQASISAQTAIVDAELSKKIEDAYLAGPGYAEYKKKQSEAAVAAEQLATTMRKAWLETDEYKKSLSDSMKLNFVDGIKEKLLEGASALAGGLITTGISKIPFGKMFGKKTKGGAPGEAAAPDASGGGGGIADVAVSGVAAGADALVPGSGAIVESVAENIQKSEEVFEKVESVKDKFKSFANTTKSIIKEIGGIFKTFAKTVGDVAKEIIKIVQDVGNQLITSITSILQKILTSVQTIGTQLADTLGNVLGKIVDNVGKILNKGVDIVTQIGNKLASGVMEMFNTVVGGLTKASGELPTLLGNLGKAVGAFFEGLGGGLAAFGNAMAAPSPAFGVPVGLIVVGIAMGLAKALDIASPGIKALTPLIIGLADVIGGTFVKAMQAAAPIIESIFNGIATVITSVGDAIVGIINSITDSIARLSGLDAGQMLAVAGGIAAMAGAIIIYGAASGIGGVLGAIGEFFGGSPVDNFKEFQQIDAGTLHAVADAITYLGRGIAGFSISPGIATAAAALGDGFEDMADYVNDGEIDSINKFAFAIQNMVNPLERVHSIYPTFSSLGSMILNLGASLDKFAGASFMGFDSLFYNVSEYKAEIITEFSEALGGLNSMLSEFSSMATGIDITAVAFMNLASALDRLGEVNIKAVNDLPWVRMTAFAGAGGRITLAQSANNSFNIAQDTAKNIEKLATDTKSNLQVSKNLQALIAVLADNGETATQVVIDGKNIATMIKRRNDNIKGRNVTPE